MRIFIKKMQGCAWGDVEYLVYREGGYQSPVAILTEHELGLLELQIAETRQIPLLAQQAKKAVK